MDRRKSNRRRPRSTRLINGSELERLRFDIPVPGVTKTQSTMDCDRQLLRKSHFEEISFVSDSADSQREKLRASPWIQRLHQEH